MRRSNVMVLLLLFILLLGGCSGNEGKELVGKWEEEWFNSLTLEFKSNGTAVFFDRVDAKYKVKGDKLTISVEGESQQFDFIVNEDTLILLANGEEIKLTRVK